MNKLCSRSSFSQVFIHNFISNTPFTSSNAPEYIRLDLDGFQVDFSTGEMLANKEKGES
jgi:hypothetical protein